jgi:hypothetical protein
MKKKHKVIMLPTDDITDIIVPTQGVGKGVIHFREYYGSAVLDMNDKYQHLYFTSDEEIKENDWYMFTDYALKGQFEQAKEVESQVPFHNCRKIIATTDKKLIILKGEFNFDVLPTTMSTEHSLPQIPQSFIEEYCKQGGIDEVELEVGLPQSIKDELLSGRLAEADKNDFILQLQINNEVITHLIEEKMYTIKEVENAYDTGYYNASSGGNGISFTFTDWIKENL